MFLTLLWPLLSLLPSDEKPQNHLHIEQSLVSLLWAYMLLLGLFPSHEDRVEGRRGAPLLESVSVQRPQNWAGNSSLHPARQECAVSGYLLLPFKPPGCCC